MFLKFLLLLNFLAILIIPAISQTSEEVPLCKETSPIDLVPKDVNEKSLSTLENKVLDEVNLARTEPSQYIGFLTQYKNYVNGKILRVPNQKPILMEEGIPVIESAIADFKQIEKLTPLKFSTGLKKVAENQLKDLKENPNLGHFGKDGSGLKKRLLRVGKYEKVASENINYKDTDPREIVLRMLIDDGVKSRTHRKNILNQQFNLLGLACGESTKDPQMICVLVFADKFNESAGSNKPKATEF